MPLRVTLVPPDPTTQNLGGPTLIASVHLASAAYLIPSAPPGAPLASDSSAI